MRYVPQVLSNATWRIKEGNISFWRDEWLENVPLVNEFPIHDRPLLKKCDCRIENGWDVDLLRNLVGESKLEAILDCLGGSKQGADMLVWKPNLNGKFSTKSAWECVRVKAPKMIWLEWIWHATLPNFSLINMWKAFNSCLSVDERIRILGVPLVSKCVCCEEGNSEDQDHKRKIYIHQPAC